MYDLMRKSIQATHAMWSNNNNNISDGNGHAVSCTAEISSITKSGNRKHSHHRPVGQSHLLFKNNNNNNNVMMMTNKSSAAAVHGGSTRVAIPRKNHASFGEPLSPTKTSSMAEKKSPKLTPRRGMESRSGGKMGSVTKASTDGPSSSNSSRAGKESPTTVSEELLPPLSSQSHLKCPTRLLIRRRSLRVVEEGGGTHIYAIRYPEDTSQMILSEQAVPFSSVVRQEQCPTCVPPPSTTTNSTTTTTHIFPTTGSSLTPTSGTSRSRRDSNSNPHSPSTKSSQASFTTTGAVTPSSSELQSKRAIMHTSLMPSATAVQGQSLSFPLTQENVGEMFAADCMAAPPRQNGM